ncbi:hypothetical protein [Daejeonella lutea]|uniref:Lipocalin-like domain-containing protein n=1 Tax=Daejeonella lutea TaxID=572036 RepID=A0A1T5ADX8_9SPHI|nr:hypothetical protein [Daejeonella lutea]SKB32873.1 hypothetical protein SAMN05661099_0589 [Daejeonella lutea]
MRIIGNILVIFLFLLSSCSKDFELKDLQGRWKYITVDNRNPQDVLPEGEIELQNPAIIFDKDNLIIEWGGKKLSSGKFRMDGKMIRYIEDLPGNQKREFPFLIKSLSKTELVFQTMEQNTTTVTATKVSGGD